MKVCKIVVNSVSHDARVLKEAEAVREAGFDVVIIGIQDANNRVPIETLDNGVVIRRAAWQSSAFQPIFLAYVWKIFALVAVVLAAVFSIDWLRNHFSETLALATFDNAIYLASVAIVGYFGVRSWRDYQRRNRSSGKIRKQEADGLLKYEAEFSAYRRVAESKVASSDAATASARDASPWSPIKKLARLHRRMPRPLMVGIGRAPRQANLRRWKVVFARERQIYDLLEEERPDLVHAHDLSALPVAAKYAQAAGTKLIFDAHEIYDHLAQSEDDMSELNAKILRKHSGDVDSFITINDSIAQYYFNTYPLLPRAVVIKNATKRTENFAYDGRLHEAAGLAGNTRILIYQGGFAPKRGLIQLLLAAEFLHSDWSLVFMGWGRLEEELLRVAEALKSKTPELDSRIRFVPRVPQSELPYWTAGASLGAIPYENTGLNHWYCNPNKLWEYPNAGVPIIASPFPELRKIIEPNGIGWFLPDPLSPREIAAAINKITPEELEVASENCRVFIRNDNWQIYADRLKALYAEMK